MIRPVSDYRIGNLVLDEDGELCKIEQLSSEKMECFQQVSTIKTQSCISDKYPSNIYAIELTEEWLIKFGFEKIWFGYEIISTGIEIEPLKNGDYTICINSNEYHVGESFKYVHQLQNIFFALTNKELELKKIINGFRKI